MKEYHTFNYFPKIHCTQCKGNREKNGDRKGCMSIKYTEEELACFFVYDVEAHRNIPWMHGLEDLLVEIPGRKDGAC